jgi:anaerobic ribonucleoside-triphosphate reductase activating protein
MNYCEIKTEDIANGPGVRVSLFVSGCNHHCKGCFQPETWNFDYGKEFGWEEIRKIAVNISDKYIDGLTILGGEPFDMKNIQTVHKIVVYVSMWHRNKTIWLYSGYTYEELLARDDFDTLDTLKRADVLVDGEFKEDLKNLLLEYRGSENQRLINLKKTFKTGNIVLWEIPKEERYERSVSRG